MTAHPYPRRTGSTVAVTGGTGFLGRALIRRLVDEGYRVRCLVQEPSGVEGLPAEIVHGDVLDSDALDRLVDGTELCFHLAALISIDGDRDGRVSRTNIEGSGRVARACRKAGVRRLVHMSSIHAYDCHGGRIDECSPRPGPTHPAYDRSKAAGEAAVREACEMGLDAVILNPCGVMGSMDSRPSRIGRVLLDLARERVPALMPGGFVWVDLRDVVDAALAAVEHGRRGESYILGGHYATLARLAAITCRLSGARPPAFTAPSWLVELGATPVTLAARLFGAEPLYTIEALRTLEASSATP